MFVEILFAQQTVGTEREAVVTGEDDDCGGGVAGLVKGVEDASDLSVGGGDAGVIVRDFFLDGLWGSWPGEEFFIANLNFAVIEGVEGEKVGGHALLTSGV